VPHRLIPPLLSATNSPISSSPQLIAVSETLFVAFEKLARFGVHARADVGEGRMLESSIVDTMQRDLSAIGKDVELPANRCVFRRFPVINGR
jgi:hypothetical protein